MKVGIIGGGAAGIMSALFACKGKNEVTIIEHNDKLLKKILSTGNGKCNFTNIKMDSSHFHNNDRAIKFIERFNQYDSIKFFNSIGVVEYVKDGYVYPNSEQAASIRNALLMELGRYDVKILLNTYVKDINKNSDVFQLNICNTENKNIKKLFFDKIIISTGLMAAPKLGSDGSFLPLLKRLNIKYNTCLPALCGIVLDNKNFFKTASGVRAKGKISVIVDGKIEVADFGELQFSGTGISGIPTFQISRYVSLYLNKNKKVIIRLDMFSHIGDIEKILNDRTKIPSFRTMEDMGNGLINIKLWLGILKMADIKADLDIKKCDKKSFLRLIEICKNMDFTALKSGDFDKSQVCTGGISLDLMDNNLMYKGIKNLYFAGEILDVDGICGGYNLQWAWTSGYIAGQVL